MPKSQRHSPTSNTYRFFVPPASLEGGAFALEDADLAHQIGAVLRLRPGDRVLLLDNSGAEHSVRLTAVERRRLAGEIERSAEAQTEPRLDLTLYAPLIRAERFEWLLQKGTELGVRRFVPLLCARTSAAEAEVGARKHERWGRILREAAEQSRRARLPALLPPARFADACAQALGHGLALLLWEHSGAAPLRQTLRALPAAPPGAALLSGPEGGLTDDERTAAQTCGIIPVTLGRRTLRAETAPLVAASALLYELGDLE